MEVLYHIRLYCVGIFPYIGLIYGRYLQFRFLKWPLIWLWINTNLNLVGGIPTPLKNMKVNWEGLSHILWKNKNVPNHQPVMIFTALFGGWHLMNVHKSTIYELFWCELQVGFDPFPYRIYTWGTLVVELITRWCIYWNILLVNILFNILKKWFL